MGAVYEVDRWNLQGWHYMAEDATDMTYLEAGIQATDNLGLGLQYADQSGGGFGGNVIGVSAELGLGDFTLAAAHNKVSDGQVTNGFGGGPFFTSSEDHTIAEVDDQKATLLGVEYGGFGNLTLGLTHVDFDKGEDETDFVASYAFNDKLSADLIYSDMNGGGDMTRAFINYNF